MNPTNDNHIPQNHVEGDLDSIEVQSSDPQKRNSIRAHSVVTMGEDDHHPSHTSGLSLPPESTISPIIEFDSDEFEDAPDLSNEPVCPKDVMERTLAFERSENRWNTAKHYELPKVGETVSNYCIEDELGRGGFGAVYRAKNLILGRDEALKLILPSAKDECADIEKRFKREINIVSRLEHPNIVRLYSSGMLRHNILWMTMELVQGSRLDDRLAQYGPFTFERAKNLMLQFLCGLMEAHRRQIVHRDLKPANIMLSKKEGYIDQVVILDFGLSKALGSDEDSDVQELTCVDEKRIYGTPQYMAPEQINSGKLGPWTDVYAAGLIFFELLTGQAAVPGDSLFDIAYKQSYEPINFPNFLRNTAIQVVIEKACAKNPAERYNNAGEFFDALQHIYAVTDRPNVLDDERRSGIGFNCIAMRPQNCDAAEQPTQIGLSAMDSLQIKAISRDTPPPQREVIREEVKRPPSVIFIVLMIVASIIILAFLFLLFKWACGDLDIRYIPYGQSRLIH